MLEWIALAAGVMMQADNQCRMIADLSDGEEVDRWQVVNDGVMGGLSRGSIAPDDGSLLFSGDINTNGGGFSSIRRGVEPGALAGVTKLRVTMKTEGRAYQFTLRSDVAWRGRPVAYRAPLELADGDNGWQVAIVSMDALEPSIFGQRVRAPAYDPAETRSIGFILADGQDGPFRAMIRSIEAC